MGGFQCQCARCHRRNDFARAFHCPATQSGCSGLVYACCDSGIGCCSACGKMLQPETVQRVLAAEAEILKTVGVALIPLLERASGPGDFPVSEVLAFIGRCSS